jgi:RND family efflux transporter MFP subunit
MDKILNCFILLQILMLSCSSQDGSSILSTQTKSGQESVTIKRIPYTYSGVVKATLEGTLAFKKSGQIISMPVHSGQQIKQGELIAQIQSKTEEYQLQTAQNSYLTAESIYFRNRRLLEEGAISSQDFEITQTNYFQAKAALEVAKSALSNTKLTAPFDGFVEKKWVKQYDVVQAGESIITLVNPEKLEIHFTLPINNSSILHHPKELYVKFDTQKEILFKASIKKYIYTSNNLGIPVILEITDKQFKTYQHQIMPGFSCHVIWFTLPHETDRMK